MSIQVKFLKPFYSKVKGTKLHLVFGYQYFSIMKGDDIFHFIPIEGKEMIVDLNTCQVENLKEVFVFQRGNRFIRLPLYQLLLVSNVHEYLMPIIEGVSADLEPAKAADPFQLREETETFIAKMEIANLENLIDQALEIGDKTLFVRLATELNKTKQLQALQTV